MEGGGGDRERESEGGREREGERERGREGGGEPVCWLTLGKS